MFSGKKKTLKLMFVGLDKAGKTSILKAIEGEPITKIPPTYGFNIRNYEMKNCYLNIWDIGGGPDQRDYWSTYVDSADGLVYVIDSTNQKNLDQAGEALINLLTEPQLESLPLLIMVNKIDVEGALSQKAVSKRLHLDDINDRFFTIYETSAKTGKGILEALEWISAILINAEAFEIGKVPIGNMEDAKAKSLHVAKGPEDALEKLVDRSAVSVELVGGMDLKENKVAPEPSGMVVKGKGFDKTEDLLKKRKEEEGGEEGGVEDSVVKGAGDDLADEAEG